MKKGLRFSYAYLLGAFFLLASLFILGRMIYFCFSQDIWYDEVFSVGMISYSYGEIVNFTARDVHPPLYYWYLKTVVDFGKLLFPGADTIILAKLAAVLPMAGLWLLAASRIRKSFGLLTAGVFIFCVYSMPQLTVYGIEIRMYSFALLLVTLSFFFAYDIVMQGRTRDFTGLFICGLMTAYTQYFSCIGIVILYLFLLCVLRKDRDAIKKWLLCVGGSILAYLPWLGILVRQFTTVKGSYWIPPLTWKSFAGCIKYIYLPSGGYPWLNYGLAVLMILATLILGILYMKKLGKPGRWFVKEGVNLLFGWGMLAGVILLGVGVSILVSPVFVYRYMIPFLGAFWFCFAFLLGKCDKKILLTFLCLLTLWVGYSNVKGVFWEENNKKAYMEETIKGLGKIGQEDILIFNFNHVQAVVGYYLDNGSYLLYQEPEQLIREIYGDYRMLSDSSRVEELLKEEGKRVWFLGSFNAREEIVNEWRGRGLRITEEGSYLLERYWFNLYRVED